MVEFACATCRSWGIVHLMNGEEKKDQDSYRSFLLMSEIDGDEHLSQRELAKRLGIALGLVNSYLKNFVSKGFVRVKTFPRNRYAYLLTPQGVIEKSRLAYQHLCYFNSLYKVARQDYLTLFRIMATEGIKTVVFCGVDEVAEIAYLSLREAGLKLVAVVDNEKAGEKFFDHVIGPLAEFKGGGHPVVVTSLKRGASLHESLKGRGVSPSSIYAVGGQSVESVNSFDCKGIGEI